MTINNSLLLSTDEAIKSSSIVIGALILKKLQRKERIIIFELYPYIKKELGLFNYENTISALIFLYINNIVDFNPPYIYNLAIINKRK